MDSWIVHAWEVFDSWIVPEWSLKNKELFLIGLVDRHAAQSLKNKQLFRIGLVDRPRVGGVRLVEYPRIEP